MFHCSKKRYYFSSIFVLLKILLKQCFIWGIGCPPAYVYYDELHGKHFLDLSCRFSTKAYWFEIQTIFNPQRSYIFHEKEQKRYTIESAHKKHYGTFKKGWSRLLPCTTVERCPAAKRKLCCCIRPSTTSSSSPSTSSHRPWWWPVASAKLRARAGIPCQSTGG